MATSVCQRDTNTKGMDLNGVDPLLIASMQLTSLWSAPDGNILELCQVFLLNFYLRVYGRQRLFAVLQAEHERRRLNWKPALITLGALFLLTSFMQSNAYRALANMIAAIRTRVGAELRRRALAREQQVG